MIVATLTAVADQPNSTSHDAFLTMLPTLDYHAHFRFRHLRCSGRRQDAAAEMVALAWSWEVRKLGNGKNLAEFPASVASLAARAVGSGRRWPTTNGPAT